MAVIKCPSCQRSVSEFAETCRHCGAAINQPATQPVIAPAKQVSSKLINCKECGHSVSKTAKVCPGCGAKLPKQIGVLGWFILLAFTVLIVKCTSSSVHNSERNITPEEQGRALLESRLSDAKYQCREFVSNSLKAPSTAKFQDYNDFYASPNGPGYYRVEGYVDSQNSFGAMIRTNFACELKRSDSGQWLLVNLKST